MTAEVRTTPTFSVASQKRLFSFAGYFPPYDVSALGKRFVMLRMGTSTAAKDDSGGLVVVVNFFSELKRLLP